MSARILAEFGVYGRQSDDERNVLALADEFRRELCALYHERHRRTVDYRNDRFPALWSAMVEFERLFAVIVETERAIKAHHSEVRDRNAVPDELAAKLVDAREERGELAKRIKSLRAEWSAHLKAFGQWWKAAADWKNVKSLEARRIAYANLEPPDEFADYLAMHTDLDVRERELFREYQRRGLHSAIRAEIVEASKPKLKKDGPGMRYVCGREPEPKPWRKMVLQFVGGAKWSDVLSGKCPSLKARPVYANHPNGGVEQVIEIEQQIGTADCPRRIEYSMKLDKPMPDDAVLQRWTLAIGDGGRRTVMPLLNDVPAKMVGNGAFGYRLRWSKRPDGIEVAEFRGDHVNERLVLPTWLVARRMEYSVAQTDADNRANELLEIRGISRSKKPGSLHGFAALESYCESHPNDNRAENLRYSLTAKLRRAKRESDRALRCIEDIYRSTAAKVCRLHDAVHHPELDLQKIKRYDSRDLLREDVLLPESRAILHAVAPGKLREAIAAYGLASADVATELPSAARETDLVTSYVRSLGVKTGRKESLPCRRSQTGSRDVARR